MGTTVIISEHRLEDVLPISDRVLFMERGEISFDGNVPEFIEYISGFGGKKFWRAMPVASQISIGLGCKTHHPISVRDGRLWLEDYCEKNNIHPILPVRKEAPSNRNIVLETRDVWFRYPDRNEFVLQSLSVQIKQNTLHAIVGGNGSGKTTALGVLTGLYAPIRGSVLYQGRAVKKAKKGKVEIGLLPQNPKNTFVCDSVWEELLEAAQNTTLDSGEAKNLAQAMAEQLNLTALLERHPYDLSGGEQQKAALAKLLLLSPKVLLLDEPSKGLDVDSKATLARMLQGLVQEGKTVVMVTHDIEFAARYAQECTMIFRGSVVCSQTAGDFFAGNSFYTTSANRIARERFPQAITSEDVILACQGIE